MEGRVVHILGSPQLVLSEPWGCHTSPAEIGKEPAGCCRDQTCPSCLCCLPRGTPGEWTRNFGTQPQSKRAPCSWGKSKSFTCALSSFYIFCGPAFSPGPWRWWFPKGLKGLGGTPRVKPPEEKRITACLSALDSPLGPCPCRVNCTGNGH